MKKFLLITFCILLVLGGAGAWWYYHNFRASKFTPVQLSQTEKKVLDDKINTAQAPAAPNSPPEKTIVLTEREINGWLERQGLGETVKVSISGGSIAASALVPLNKDVPFLGGHTMRIKVALHPQMDAKNHFGLFVSDVSVGGISPPNAWLGGLKGTDLLADSSADATAVAFAKGIKNFDINSGEIRVVLNE